MRALCRPPHQACSIKVCPQDTRPITRAMSAPDCLDQRINQESGPSARWPALRQQFVFFFRQHRKLIIFWICGPHGANSHCIVHSYGHYRYVGFCSCSVCFEPSTVRGTWGRDSVRFSWCVFTQSQPGIRQISFTQSDKQYFSSDVRFYYNFFFNGLAFDIPN